jgi:hypothetical protein
MASEWLDGCARFVVKLFTHLSVNMVFYREHIITENVDVKNNRIIGTVELFFAGKC